MERKSDYGYLIVEPGREPERIFYELDGSGEDIIFFNAPFLDRRMWFPQVTFFSERGYRTLSFDQRGFGKSDLPRSKYSSISDILKLLDHLKIKYFHAVCSSRGCLTAIDLLDLLPERVKSITFSGPLLSEGTLENETLKLFWNDLQKKENEVDSLMKVGKFRDAVSLNTSIWTRGMDHISRERLEEIAIDNYRNLRRDFNTTQESANTDRLKKLSKSSVRKLLIMGDRDLPVVSECAKHLEGVASNITAVTIEGSGHFPNIEQMNKFNNTLLEFIGSS